MYGEMRGLPGIAHQLRCSSQAAKTLSGQHDREPERRLGAGVNAGLLGFGVQPTGEADGDAGVRSAYLESNAASVGVGACGYAQLAGSSELRGRVESSREHL